MDSLVPNNLLMLAVYIVAALLIGYFVGSRHSRKQLKDMLRDFNQQSLDMLDVKSDHAKLTKFLGQSHRKDRLLKLTLKQLKAANNRAALLQKRLGHVEKQHYIKTSRLRLLATHATDKARRATSIATRATNHLKQLEQNLPPTQTINAPPPKSYGQAAAVPVRVVDKHAPEAQKEAITRVSNRDSARLTRLRSSNEVHRFNSANLQAIDGISPSVEKKLNQAGIHRVEQLANMSDSDMAALNGVFEDSDSINDTQNYTAAWKGGAQRLLGQS